MLTETKHIRMVYQNASSLWRLWGWVFVFLIILLLLPLQGVECTSDATSTRGKLRMGNLRRNMHQGEQSPKMLEFGVADETAWEVGLSCGGRIRVYVEPVAA